MDGVLDAGSVSASAHVSCGMRRKAGSNDLTLPAIFAAIFGGPPYDGAPDGWRGDISPLCAFAPPFLRRSRRCRRRRRACSPRSTRTPPR